MRELELNGKVFEVRGLLRKEIKGLKKYGFTSLLFNPGDGDLIEEGMEAALKMVLKDDQLAALDDLPNRDFLKVFKALTAETYGAPDEEKN